MLQACVCTLMLQGHTDMGHTLRDIGSRETRVQTLDQKLVTNNDTSIAYQELFPIVLAASVWDHIWSQKRIMFYCDNEATVTAINKGTSRSPLMAKLLRKLTLCSILGALVIRASNVPVKINHISDALSHNQVSKFFILAP